MDSEIITLASSFAVYSGGSFFAGWGLGKLFKIAIKALAVAAGIFTLALGYMQAQGLIAVNWHKIDASSSHIVQNLLSNGVISQNGDIFNVVTHTLGLPVLTGVGMGFGMGFLYGVKS
jgi:uncharacterized membrane protein (Fun14 family)